MHIRPKPWARPELEASPIFVPRPWEEKNHWRMRFAHPEHPLFGEFGCGKGQFMAQTAAAHPKANFIAVDMIDTMLGMARRKITIAQDTERPDNVLLTAWDVERIDHIFGPGEHFDGLFINFCNPWPKRQKHKKRLTHIRQLEKYKVFLAAQAVIHFKTDDDNLFKDSLGYFAAAGFAIADIRRDLAATPIEGYAVTEHEAMFSTKGFPIKYARAVLKK